MKTPPSENALQMDQLRIAAMNVITSWTHVEMALTELLAAALAKPVGLAAAILEATINIRARATIMREVLAQSPQGADQSALLDALIGKAEHLSGIRNKYAHCAVGFLGSTGPFIFPQISLKPIPLDKNVDKRTLAQARHDARCIMDLVEAVDWARWDMFRTPSILQKAPPEQPPRLILDLREQPPAPPQ